VGGRVVSTKTNAMLAVGLVLVALLGAGVAIVPKLSAASVARAEIEGFEAELAEPNAGPEAIAMLEERIEIMSAIGEDRITPIPERADLADLMRRLSQMFESAGIEPPQLTTGVPEQEKGVMAMPMTIVASGGFTALAETIGRIEALPRLIRVQRVRLATDASRGSGDIDRAAPVRADLLLDVFYDAGAERAEGAG
jgi:Tfp pilus assembly protein PilO